MQNSILDDHRNMLMFSKNLSQFQINNLQTWPSIFFEGVTETKLSWNFVNAEGLFYAGSVEFEIQTIHLDSPERSVDFLIGATKALFWSDTKVCITINNSVCYRE